MKNLFSDEIDKFRVRSQAIIDHFGSTGDHETGIFRLPTKSRGNWMKVIASVRDGWDHVSASTENRTPKWVEMDQIKRLFFHDWEVVMQLHVAEKDHINYHPYCLHLWRPLHAEIPLPPAYMIGPTDHEVKKHLATLDGSALMAKQAELSK